MKNTFNFKFWYLYLIIVLLYVVISYLSYKHIYTDNFYYIILSKKMDVDRITNIVTMQHKYHYIGYLLLPVLILFKFCILAGIIFTGLFLFNQKVTYGNCLKIVVIAELVFVAATIIKTTWLIVSMPNNVNDIQYFSPLSLAQLINFNTFSKYTFYPLQLINIFEVIYWIVLAYGVMAFTNCKFGKSLKVIAYSYGLALLVWVIIVIDVQVQFSI